MTGERLLDWLVSEKRNQYEHKIDVLGPSGGQAQEVWVSESNPSDWNTSLISGLQRELLQNWRWKHYVSTPCIQDGVTTSKGSLYKGADMDANEASRCRAPEARLHNLASGRPDVLFSCKVCKYEMAVPRFSGRESCWASWTQLDTVLQHWCRSVTGQAPTRTSKGCADPIGAGCRQDVKSTRGGVILRGGHCIKAVIGVAVDGGSELWRSRVVCQDENHRTDELCVQHGSKDLVSVWQELGSRTPKNAMELANRDGLGGRCMQINAHYL